MEGMEFDDFSRVFIKNENGQSFDLRTHLNFNHL